MAIKYLKEIWPRIIALLTSEYSFLLNTALILYFLKCVRLSVAELESRTNCYFCDGRRSIFSTPTNNMYNNLYTFNLLSFYGNTFLKLRLMYTES